MSQYVFINITDSHFKVWGFDAFRGNNGSGETIAYWGKIGVPMQQLNKKRKQFNSYGDACKYMQKKIAEKLCKGYKGFPNWLYFQMIQSPSGITALIEKISAMEIGQGYWCRIEKASR